MKFLEFFQEDNGGLSSMRLMSFIALIVAVLITSSIIAKYLQINSAELATAFSSTITSIIYVLMVWVVGAFVPKTLQKIVEQKISGPGFSVTAAPSDGTAPAPDQQNIPAS